MMPGVANQLAEQILEDCRGAVGEVRFGFGSKRQVWAFEDRHRIDVAGLADRLAKGSPAAFLHFAVAFHDEFAAVSNAWRLRDRIQELVADLCRGGAVDILEHAAEALVDRHLVVRHWLLAAFVAGPPPIVIRALEDALTRAYQPQDHWALMSRLRALAQEHGWAFSADTNRLLINLAQFSPRSEDRLAALDLLARFGGPAATPCLARAAKGDADPAVRAHATNLLIPSPSGRGLG